MLPHTQHARIVSQQPSKRNTRTTHARSTPRKPRCRPQLNLKLPAPLIASFRAFCAAQGLSQRAVIEAALVAFMGGLPALASSDVPEKTEQQEEKLASAPAPTPAEVTEMREELAAVREAFPRMVATARPPNRADANNVLRWARRAVPDAIPRDVAWFIRGKVDGGQRWRSWGGVVVAAGDYARADAPQTREQNRKNTPQVVEPQYGPSFAEWLAGREATEELEAEWLMA